MARRTFFSFHYDADCRRACNVRNSWVVRPAEEESRGFFDGSAFEESKLKGVGALKEFLKKELANTSVTCVLAGSKTWERRWVRYEIAQSLLKGNGLLTVNIHGVRDMNDGVSVKGPNPLDAMGLYKTSRGIYFAEWKGGKWVQYMDHGDPVAPGVLWFPAPSDNKVVALSTNCSVHDFAADDGRRLIGSWIEAAAVRAGR